MRAWKEDWRAPQSKLRQHKSPGPIDSSADYRAAPASSAGRIGLHVFPTANATWRIGMLLRGILKQSGAAVCLACCALGSAHQPASAADRAMVFAPATGVKATLTVHEQQVEVTVTGPRGRSTDTLPFETEHPLRVNVEDYNFDGHKDFSVSHLDDGKGTYDLYDIYVYAPKSGKFERLVPTCGEDFINVRLDRTRRALINTRVENYRFTACRMTF